MLIGEIRDDVPVPEVIDKWKSIKFPTAGRPMELLRHRVESLNVGESFSITAQEGEDIRKMKDRLSSARKQTMKKKPCRFTVKRVGENEFTIWRIE